MTKYMFQAVRFERESINEPDQYPDPGHIEASDPMTALKDVHRDHEKKGIRLYSAFIMRNDVGYDGQDPILAYFLSIPAATRQAAPKGETRKWTDDGLLVDGILTPRRNGRFTLVEDKPATPSLEERVPILT